ncbi:MAG: hypothetical protein N4A48_06425 [Tepidibacter sp.]|jgi:hypothetical protein|uniref:hypothetical protein n=1 Tax=Tepidibacter sp. TaxID=2529387 RepID=UPI0025D5EDE6|nr:hypothetical protein [Tepidibacter sp.]MCT4508386.1 hypothetical protein [Tepidibacter sp.]
MGIVRNFINIKGITQEDKLPSKVNGQIIQYSDTETIFIPRDKSGVKNIYEIMIDIDISSTRTINTPLGKTIVIDGVKKYKIMYTENGDVEKANIIYINTPYNTFVELPNNANLNNINIHIMDAYFDLISIRKIHSYTVYLLDVDYTVEGRNINNNTEYILEGRNTNSNKEISVCGFKENIKVDVDERFNIEFKENFNYKPDQEILKEMSISKEEYEEDESIDTDEELIEIETDKEDEDYKSIDIDEEYL